MSGPRYVARRCGQKWCVYDTFGPGMKFAAGPFGTLEQALSRAAELNRSRS